MDYKSYNIEDFVRDPFFQKWIVDPDKETVEFWNSWVNDHPKKERIIEEAKAMILLMNFGKDPAVNDMMVDGWKNVSFVLDQYQHLESPDKVQHSGQLLFKIAASIILFLLFGGGLFYYYQSNRVIEIATKAGELKTIQLPDGSIVELNNYSSLTYHPDFISKKERHVYLVGEAFFKVKKNKAKPFIVKTNDIEVKVLGTSFNVKAYQNDRITSTTLIEGSVAIKKADDEKQIFLKPYYTAVFEKKTKTLEVNRTDVDIATSWKNNQVRFRNTPLLEVIEQVNRKFGINIIADGKKFKNCSISGDFSGQPIDVILEFITKPINATFKKTNTQIIIKGNGCN